MPTRRSLKGVLAGFLGTYTSRYSEYDGYWIFGFLVGELQPLEFDLIEPDRISVEGPLRNAGELARIKFAQQLSKAGLDSSRVKNARLCIERRSDGRSVPGQHFRNGYSVRFHATATADNGRRFECEKTVFVAPHDSSLERRSGNGA
jgi:hypothetical protein